jgi:quercetin dioxygenase-like cupin family protein
MMAFTRIVRMYTGADQRSHFEELAVPMEEFRLGSAVSLKSEVVPVTGVDFRNNPSTCSPDFHNAPRRQFMITLTGAVEMRVGDGSTRVLGPGDVLLAEDVTGEGHSVRELLGPRRSLILPLPDDFDISRWRKAS